MRAILWAIIPITALAAAYLCAGIIFPAREGVLALSDLRVVLEPGEELSGGATTVSDTGRNSFSRSPKNMADFDSRWPRFRNGKAIFERNWERPIEGRVALGPAFNARSCEGCHAKDGRGRPTSDTASFSESIVFQLGMVDAAGRTITGGDPHYGEQLDYFGRDGIASEGRVAITYHDVDGGFADGEEYRLAKPDYAFTELARGPLDRRTAFSPRVAPPTFGLGLLEAIPEEQITALADPDDRDSNGISGRPNYVLDLARNRRSLGRFGWKANQPTLEQQVLKAFAADMGVTSAMFPAGADRSAARELSADDAATVLFYVRLLAVPARRDWERPDVLRGKGLFRAIGCAACHAERFTTGDVPGFPEVSRQTIHPYTDLLLHDMGEDLADRRPDGMADGREWRTPPLWGIGLVRRVSRHTRFLHDGRARDIAEAILWHGGEGRGSRDLFRRLSQADRSALLRFLESL